VVANTLAEISKKPFLIPNTYATNASLKDCVATMKQRVNALGSSAEPEEEALRFYMMNHAWAELNLMYHKDQPLPQEHLDVALGYTQQCSQIMERLFYYLLMICTRETRHCQNPGAIQVANYPIECWNFLNSIQGSGSGGAVSKLKSSAPNVNLGVYTDFMEYVFFKGKFSGGYGGPAWGEVARTLNRYVSAAYTPEMMVDTGWTLCHNNGPIFNKGMLYNMYSQELVQMLDVQRSGQIPQLLYSHNAGMKFFNKISIPALKTYEWLRDAKLSADWETHIDWEKVMKLGSHGNYHAWAIKMNNTPEVAEKKAKKEKEEFFYVTPHVKVKKLKRKDLIAA